jgi:hypothetical protein
VSRLGRNIGLHRRVDWSGAGLIERDAMERPLPKENDLEGDQDQGGKHGGQAGQPKSPRPPKTTERDEDVIRKGSQQGSKDR